MADLAYGEVCAMNDIEARRRLASPRWRDLLGALLAVLESESVAKYEAGAGCQEAQANAWAERRLGELDELTRVVFVLAGIQDA